MMHDYYKHIKHQIQVGEIEEIYSDDEVVCPWCGNIYPKEDDYSLLEEGNHICQCNCCDRKFTAETEISYTFSTTREVEQP